tara:strand:+ start:172404 stop:173111 length:708 start_codon:yes stop_codon:yes gene_type:complete
MTTPPTNENDNATPPNNDAASVEKLQAALKAEREAHKATKAQYLAPVREALTLGDDASLDDITAALTTRLGEVDAQLKERTDALTTERDDAIARAEKIEDEWAADKITAALGSAFASSGADKQNAADFMALATPLFTVADDGRTVTRDDAPGVVPGLDPDQWIVSQLRSARPHWWALSVGGGAKGGGGIPSGMGDTSCFDPRSAKFSVTAQFAYESHYGRAAADAAIARFKGVRR